MTNSRAIVCMLARQVEGLEIIRYLICRHAEDDLAVRFAFSAVQHRDDLAVTIEDRTPRRPRAPYASTCTTEDSDLLTVPTVSVGSAIGWPPCAPIGRSNPS